MNNSSLFVLTKKMVFPWKYHLLLFFFIYFSKDYLCI